MNKILLALSIFGVGAGGFFGTHRAAERARQEARATREAWLTETRMLATVQGEQADLRGHAKGLEEALSHTPTASGNLLWSALQTNRDAPLAPELREHLLEELGFNWRSSEDFIVVSKETIREVQMRAISQGKLTDVAVSVLAMTPAERDQVEGALQRVRADYKDWAVAHVERHEPHDDIVAYYVMPGDSEMSISNSFASALFNALGRQRADLMLPSVRTWMDNIGLLNKKLARLIVKRESDGSHQRLKYQTQPNSRNSWDLWKGLRFPETFRPIFTNGWVDIATREGFELPEEAPPSDDQKGGTK